jgi:hypothetical protein
MNKHKKIIILSLIVTLSLICIITFIAHANNCDSYIKKLQDKLPIEKVFGKKIEEYSMAFDGGSYIVELTDGTIISSKWDMFSGKEEITCTPPSKEYQQPNCDTYIKEILNTKKDKYSIYVNFRNKIKESSGDGYRDPKPLKLTFYNGTQISVDVENDGKITCIPANSSTPIIAYYPNNK